MSISTLNIPNCLRKNSNVILVRAELAAISSKLGRIPKVAEFHMAIGIVNKDGQ